MSKHSATAIRQLPRFSVLQMEQVGGFRTGSILRIVSSGRGGRGPGGAATSSGGQQPPHHLERGRSAAASPCLPDPGRPLFPAPFRAGAGPGAPAAAGGLRALPAAPRAAGGRGGGPDQRQVAGGMRGGPACCWHGGALLPTRRLTPASPQPPHPLDPRALTPSPSPPTPPACCAALCVQRSTASWCGAACARSWPQGTARCPFTPRTSPSTSTLPSCSPSWTCRWWVQSGACVCGGGGGVLWGRARGGACVSLQNSSCMLLLPAHLTSLSPPAPPPPSTHPPPPAHQTVKMGVQYSLWGGSILNLGTERHRRRYFDDIDRFRLPGCFAMTELKHGSNVAGLQTEATLDVHTDEWVVHVSEPCQPGGGCGGCAAAAAAAAAAAVQAGGQTAGWEAESCAAQCTGPPLISQRPAAAAAAAATTSMMPHPRPCLCCPPPLPVLPPAPPSRLCLCPPPPADARRGLHQVVDRQRGRGRACSHRVCPPQGGKAQSRPEARPGRTPGGVCHPSSYNCCPSP